MTTEQKIIKYISDITGGTVKLKTVVAKNIINLCEKELPQNNKPYAQLFRFKDGWNVVRTVETTLEEIELKKQYQSKCQDCYRWDCYDGKKLIVSIFSINPVMF